MKLQFKHQKFQADAAKAVVDVFAGQPASSVSRYLIDRGLEKMDQIDVEGMVFTGWRNEPVIVNSGVRAPLARSFSTTVTEK